MALMKRVALYVGVALTLVLFLGLVAYSQRRSLSEAQTITNGVSDFQELSVRFQELAKKKGALYAYDILRKADLPSNTDVHLLGHTVGDILYEQKGVSGVGYCTQEFRNACSHAIVIGALDEFGEGALPKIHDACKRAPGGSGAYTMCYHGLGHGVFAFFEYDIPKTIAFCKKMGTAEYHDEEYVQCVGGAIMELMGGGGHDRGHWLTSREKYLLKTDPLAPCSTSIIPEEAKGFCYTYITPHLFGFAGADMGNPQPNEFKAAFLYCDKISKTAPRQRLACFAGIGKELSLLAVARDTRALLSASDDNLAQMRAWCSVAPHDEAYKDCTDSIVDSLFWGGENDVHLSTRYCSLATGTEREECFDYLITIGMQYLKEANQREQFCAILPDDFGARCRNSS